MTAPAPFDVCEPLPERVRERLVAAESHLRRAVAGAAHDEPDGVLDLLASLDHHRPSANVGSRPDSPAELPRRAETEAITMPKACVPNIPETKKGAGPCQISFEVRKRNGKPNWWCRTHGMEASAPDGSALESCPGVWFEAVPDERQLDLDTDDGVFSVWGAVAPAITIGDFTPEDGHVHVHHRPAVGAGKDIDGSYDIVRVHRRDDLVVVESMAAVAYSISELAGRQVKALPCTRCGEWHIDERKFATFPHSKHLCNS